MPPRPSRSVIWYSRERSRRITLNSSAGILSPSVAFVLASGASSLGDMEVRSPGIGIPAERNPRAAARRLVAGVCTPMVAGLEEGHRVPRSRRGGAARRYAGAAVQVRRSIERGAGRLDLDLEHQSVARIDVRYHRLESHGLRAAQPTTGAPADGNHGGAVELIQRQRVDRRVLRNPVDPEVGRGLRVHTEAQPAAAALRLIAGARLPMEPRVLRQTGAVNPCCLAHPNEAARVIWRATEGTRRVDDLELEPHRVARIGISDRRLEHDLALRGRRADTD